MHILRRIIPVFILVTNLLVSIAYGQAATAEQETSIKPPVATRKNHKLTIHGDTRIDPYYWLRDDARKDPEVLDYLKAENDYTKAMMAHTHDLQEQLFQEIVGRIKQDDSTVPVKEGNYWYYTRYEIGKEYPIVARKKSKDAAEELMIDGNQRAEGHNFYHLGNWEVSSNEDILAFAEDTVSRRQYTIRFKNLKTGKMYPDELQNVDPAMAWANDGKTLFYIEKHPQTLLAYKVRKHVLGTDPSTDPVVREETDTEFYTDVYKSRSQKFIIIYHNSTISTEVRYLPADNPDGAFKIFLPREKDHEYEIEDLGNRFFVRTNWQAPNFRIMEVPIDQSSNKSAWKDVVPHRSDVFIHEFQTFDNYLAISERSGGLRKIRIRPWQGGKEYMLSFDEPSYAAYLEKNPEPTTDVIRYSYTSLTTPESIYEIDLKTAEKILLKRQPVLGGFDSNNYATEFLFAPARDGVKIPVSIVYRKGFKKDGTAALYQTGYGSYGSSNDPEFESKWISLLDRGFVVAIAHIRGGQEMGRQWYDEGKLLKKKNTFTDFIDVTKFLVEQRYAHPDKVFAMGGSAGGLLMGAVANMAPQSYRGIIAYVPFVDVVTTMLDDSIPLTSNEFNEWGSPKVKEYYRYMLSYSPYDQVRKQDYPAILVTTGLWDSQVQYFEPAKWVAKLRAMKTDGNSLLFHINMEGGHGGVSGRFRRLRETALEYAFILDQLNRSMRKS